MAVKKKNWWVRKPSEQETPKIYVRRNGSRYIDPDELFRNPKVQETLQKLRSRDLTPNERSKE